MPIAGFVVTVAPAMKEEVKGRLNSVEGCDVFDGVAEKGTSGSAHSSIVITLETETTSQMEDLVEALKKIDGVLTVDLAYLNIEDEVEK